MMIIQLIKHEMRTQARENLISVEEKSKIYYDRKINPLQVKIFRYVTSRDVFECI